MSEAIDYQEKARQYVEEGFCVIPNVLEAPLIEALREVTDAELAALPAAHREAQKSTGSMVSVTVHPLLAQLIGHRGALDAYARMGFDDVRFTSGYIISKPPHSPRLFWHFDWMGWAHPVSYEKRPLQTFFMYYLVDTTRHNGCLRVIPKTHLNDHPLHQQMHDAHTAALSRAERLDLPEFADQPDEIDVPVRAGDLVIGDSRLLHASHANESDAARTVITLWMHPLFRQLPEPIQAFCSRNNQLPEDWPAEALALIQPLRPSYSGEAEPPVFSRQRVPRPA